MVLKGINQTWRDYKNKPPNKELLLRRISFAFREG
jgi:hypothetical protein